MSMLTDDERARRDDMAASESAGISAGDQGVATLLAAGRGTHGKTSYESNADVQRWLQEQALEEGGTRGAFTPTFLAHQRDRLWVLSSLRHFYEERLIADVLAVAKSGKEANVYCCAADPATGAEFLAAKVYRPRMFRNLKNDAVYRRGRAQLDERGREVRGPRVWRGANRDTERGRAAQVASWIQYEFQTLRLLYEAGADVPGPIAQIGNAELMEFVGTGTEAAPALREVTLDREEARGVFDRILRNVELALACDRVHGDLSAYNVLYHAGAPVIIDFAQAVDPRYSPEAGDLLARDVERVCRHFARYGVEADAAALAADLWERYLRGEV
jgi:RIO kinase 1